MKKITYFNVLVFTVLLLTMGGCNEDKFLKKILVMHFILKIYL